MLEVLIHGPLSRTEIARRLDLSQPSLSRLSAPLLEGGLLVEGEERSDGRTGRPSRPLDVVADSRHFIGVKLTGDEALGVVTDLRANVVASAARSLPGRDPEQVADVLAALVLELSAGVPAVAAVGVGLGGLVNGQNEVVRAPFLGWARVPLGRMLRDRTDLPAVVENDLVALTEAEHWFGAGRGLERFAVLTVGAAVGYGLVIHDRIVVGEDSGVGLVGHWPLQPFGPMCPEGHQGCAQALLAMPSIVKSVSMVLDRPLTYDACLDLAEAGDPAARRIVDDAGRGLGRLIAAIGNLTVPQAILLGGEGVRLARVAATAISQGIQQDRDPRANALDVQVLDGDATEWCRGAAVMAIQRYVLGDQSRRR
ncbi:ROK family transcriptional regulator [Dactylosporangium sp. AC04546]|uniref:ROK family transcriptional regulator n=1 Tax=Dactylosporangium sp. AC04546 TaxID=2862460 RepID=UPI001EDEB63C|nr:ROK family transcriptional regulator [Dactylosporangium sp. AC04546]WVK86996.1 ROK family transcriptional regulator [Dactylosporangium sp. AC04546]